MRGGWTDAGPHENRSVTPAGSSTALSTVSRYEPEPPRPRPPPPLPPPPAKPSPKFRGAEPPRLGFDPFSSPRPGSRGLRLFPRPAPIRPAPPRPGCATQGHSRSPPARRRRVRRGVCPAATILISNSWRETLTDRVCAPSPSPNYSPMARCPPTRPSAAVTTLSTPSSPRRVLASTCPAACSSTSSPP